MAAEIDTTTGTSETLEKPVIPITMRLRKVVVNPIVLRIAQLSSKYTGIAPAAMMNNQMRTRITEEMESDSNTSAGY
jgi:hypothetical protein